MINDIIQGLKDFINWLLGPWFFEAIFYAVISFLNFILGIILYPFSVLIKAYLPELDSALGAVAHSLSYAGTYAAWIIDSFGIPPAIISILGIFYAFKYGVTFIAWSSKLILKWKNAIWS